MCRLEGRHRWQASSYSWVGYIWKKWGGWQAAIAGKPAPTVDRATPTLLTTQQAER
ncbi:UNVERIFIED_ORG: hypothetical protein J2Y84_000578 [Pseudomonas reinekei]|uniref:hypothetical protein n=1 Tax=Pseudomonas laurylsulfatiphila TaxID=2011015 RepID=UPI003D1C063A|nr:hypothetical protein [Pseudomonas reinekei]